MSEDTADEYSDVDEDDDYYDDPGDHNFEREDDIDEEDEYYEEDDDYQDDEDDEYDLLDDRGVIVSDYLTLFPYIMMHTRTPDDGPPDDTGPSHDHMFDMSTRIRGNFCVYGLKFSPSGREILAGATRGLMYIYDLVAQRQTLEVAGHTQDVNSVTFIDGSDHTFASASDDQYVHVWDRRTLSSENPRPVGSLFGHRQRLTHVTARGCGTYLLSNAKDNTAKLWDLRRMAASTDTSHEDVSLQTYRGHTVFQTLIRCYFSPMETTSQRYVYSGSYTGEIFNMVVVLYVIYVGYLIHLKSYQPVGKEW
eukprot:gene12138-14201_t